MDAIKSYHDKEIVGYSFQKTDNELILELKMGECLKFNEVVQFELNYVSDQNVISNIYSWVSNNIPDYLIKDYPFLSNFRTTKTKCYYIDSSVGLTGIIICHNP